MDDRRKKDDHQAGTSSDAAGPVFTSGPYAGCSSADEFSCNFTGCSRSFPTKIGLGVHQQRVHKDWYDSQQSVHVKTRWNAEESALLARQEAKLVLQGSRFLNQDLLPFFPDRTLESIKGQRRKVQHKTLVAELLDTMRSEAVENGQTDDPTASA